MRNFACRQVSHVAAASTSKFSGEMSSGFKPKTNSRDKGKYSIIKQTRRATMCSVTDQILRDEYPQATLGSILAHTCSYCPATNLDTRRYSAELRDGVDKRHPLTCTGYRWCRAPSPTQRSHHGSHRFRITSPENGVPCEQETADFKVRTRGTQKRCTLQAENSPSSSRISHGNCKNSRVLTPTYHIQRVR